MDKISGSAKKLAQSQNNKLSFDAQMENLKKIVGPLEYAHSAVPDLLRTQVAEQEEIAPELVKACKHRILRMLEVVFTALVEERRGSLEEWPTALQGLAPYRHDQQGLESLMVYANALTPDLSFTAFSVHLDMTKVPVFMEWQTSDTTACRVMCDVTKSHFIVMHLVYEAYEDGLLHVAGAIPSLHNIFAFSMDDLHTVSRLRTIDAAFTVLEFDEDGEVAGFYAQLHSMFSKYSMCH